MSSNDNTNSSNPSSPRFASNDPSSNLLSGISDPIIPNPLLNQTTNDGLTIVTNIQGIDISGSMRTDTSFVTILNNMIDIQINENLDSQVIITDNTTDISANPSAQLLAQIKSYAQEIQCSDFQGKGTLDDYNELFIAASKIANETKQISLSVDTTGFEQFADAADELAALFESFITKLSNINIISDVGFLTIVSNALGRIVNLSNTFGRFKQTIIATSQIQIPKSAFETNTLLQDVNTQLSCAMNYIGYFVDPTGASSTVQSNAQLSQDEKQIISKAVSAIDNWAELSDQGLTISLATNPNIIGISESNQRFIEKTTGLKNLTLRLKTKLDTYKNI
jgi:hypothetical protein